MKRLGFAFAFALAAGSCTSEEPATCESAIATICLQACGCNADGDTCFVHQSDGSAAGYSSAEFCAFELQAMYCTEPPPDIDWESCEDAIEGAGCNGDAIDPGVDWQPQCDE